jgi:hypothetical protein
MATSGLYGFKNMNTFKNNYSSKYVYISTIFNKMIRDGNGVVVGDKYKESDTIVLGSPKEYINASNIYI